MLWRRQHPIPGSYEEFLQANKRWIETGPKYQDGYDNIAHQENTEDRGSLYRMHIIRQQAAFDLQTSAGEHGYITEQDIDSYLIANHEPDEGEEERTLAARHKAQATMDMIRASLSVQRRISLRTTSTSDAPSTITNATEARLGPLLPLIAGTP